MRTYLLLVALLLGPAISLSLADEWPQWMGPGRDNIWREEGILPAFPAGGPRVLWRAPVAGGYSGPAVAGGRVYVTDYVTADDVKVPNFERKQFSGIERVHCLSQQDGMLVWHHEYPVKYTMSYPAGPRCTPLVDGQLIYTLGGEGNLICFEAATGKIVWQRNLVEQYKTKTALWGYASQPLIDGTKLICVVGGDNSHVVAFDKRDGTEIWRSLSSPEQGYSPPTIIEAAGVRQLILLRPDAVTAVDPDTGKPLWSVDYEATSGSIIMSPIQAGEYLFVGGFSDQNLLLRLGKDRPTAEEVWRNLKKHAVSPVNVQPFLDGDTIYGIDQSGVFVAFDVASGKRLWETPEPFSSGRPVQSATAFIVRQADRYWLFTEQGDLIIAELSKSGLKQLDKAHVIDPTNVAFGRDVVWSAPAFASRCAFIRNDKECICVDLAERK